MSKLVVTGFAIEDGGKHVSTQKLAKIRKIASKTGTQGAAAVFTATSDDGKSNNWAVIVVAVDKQVFVQSLAAGDNPVYELTEQGRDLCVTQFTD